MITINFLISKLCHYLRIWESVLWWWHVKLFCYLDITEAFVFDGQLSSLMLAQCFGPCDLPDFCLKQVVLSVASVHYTLLYIHFCTIACFSFTSWGTPGPSCNVSRLNKLEPRNGAFPLLAWFGSVWRGWAPKPSAVKFSTTTRSSTRGHIVNADTVSGSDCH